MSDKHVTECCGILLLDVVVADRGFDISELVCMMQAKLYIPAFTKGKDQLFPLEIRSIAKTFESMWRRTTQVTVINSTPKYLHESEPDNNNNNFWYHSESKGTFPPSGKAPK